MFSFVDKTIPRCGKNRNRQRLPDDGILGTPAWSVLFLGIPPPMPKNAAGGRTGRCVLLREKGGEVKSV